MYDIMSCENPLAQEMFEQAPAMRQHSVCVEGIPPSGSRRERLPCPWAEEEWLLPESQVQPTPSISIDEMLKSLAVKPKVIPLRPDRPSEAPQDTPKITSPPRDDVKVDKYGFVMAEDEEEEPPTTPTKRERSLSQLPRAKKSHKLEEKWRAINKNWTIYLGEKRRKLRRNLRRGVPDSMRAELWKGLVDVSSIKEKNEELFNNLIEQPCAEDFERVILKDLSRTLPKHIMFQEGGIGRDALYKVLRAYSVYNPSVGYCQGMGFLAAMFLIYMPAEDAFFMLVQVIDRLDLAGIFAEGLIAVKEHLYIHAQLCKTHFPRLSAHLEETVQVDGMMPIEMPWDVTKLYATQWFFNLFIHVLPFEFILRIWDIILFDGFHFVHQVALAVLKVVQKDLLKMRFDEILIFLKGIDVYLSKNITPDQFIGLCEDFRVSGRMPKLHKIYMEQYLNSPM